MELRRASLSDDMPWLSGVASVKGAEFLADFVWAPAALDKQAMHHTNRICFIRNILEKGIYSHTNGHLIKHGDIEYIKKHQQFLM
jgi:hypothetical protein